MLGYTVNDIEEMIYGIESSILLINTDENPAIHRYLVDTVSFLEGILAEGRV
jgi:hypothetical protein